MEEDTSGELETLVEGPPLLGTPVTLMGDGPAVYMIDHPQAQRPEPQDGPGEPEVPGTEPGGDENPNATDDTHGGCSVGRTAPTSGTLLVWLMLGFVLVRRRVSQR